MPLGLKSGPAVFQRLMDKVLGRYKWQIALVYINDIIIYSKDFDQHLKDIQTVLGLVAKSGMTLSPKKCQIAYQSLNALGHNISHLGIGTSDNNVEAVKKFPVARNIRELQRFLGLCVYYRRFVKDFAKIAQALYLLLKKDQPYTWGAEPTSLLRGTQNTPYHGSSPHLPQLREAFHFPDRRIHFRFGWHLSTTRR
jgi:hypothetical protein